MISQNKLNTVVSIVSGTLLASAPFKSMFQHSLDDASQFIELSTFANFSGKMSFFHSYWKLGLLHLLILSGSQMNTLFNFCHYLLKKVKKNQKVSPLWIHATPFLLCFFYLWTVHFPPPLTRAFILLCVQSFLINQKAAFRIVIAFCFHFLIFPEHMTTTSFILSWASFLVLIISQKIFQSKLLQHALICTLCHLIISELNERYHYPHHYLFMAILANYYSSSLYEKFLFPLLSSYILLKPLLELFKKNFHLDFEFLLLPYQYIALAFLYLNDALNKFLSAFLSIFTRAFELF